MSSISVFHFDDSATVRTVTSGSGEVLFVGKDVASALGYADATTAIRSHCRGVQILHPIQDSMGRTQDARVLTEADVMRLIVSSNLPKAVAFERWVFEDVLPSIRKTGSYTAPAAPTLITPATEAVQLASMIADSMRVAPSGRALLIHHALQLRAPDLIGLAPVYSVDASSASVTGSSEPTASATALLKKHGIKLTASSFNNLLQNHGLLERLSRPSTGGMVKHYWSITDKGLQYGKNITSTQSQRETQPHWYVEKFGELLWSVSGLLV